MSVCVCVCHSLSLSLYLSLWFVTAAVTLCVWWNVEKAKNCLQWAFACNTTFEVSFCLVSFCLVRSCPVSFVQWAFVQWAFVWWVFVQWTFVQWAVVSFVQWAFVPWAFVQWVFVQWVLSYIYCTNIDTTITQSLLVETFPHFLPNQATSPLHQGST